MKHLPHNCSGNIAVVFALILPLLIVAGGMGVDFQHRRAQQTALQEAADNLALRAARELLIENATSQGVEALIRAWASAQYKPALGDFTITPLVDDAERTASVDIEQAPKVGFFLTRYFAADEAVSAHALAQARGVTNVCVIALEETDDYAIRATVSAKLNALKCAIMSNSTASRGVSAGALAKISANMICSAGGRDGGPMNFEPMPVTDCPVYPDPLSERMAPAVGACDENNLVLGTQAFGMALRGPAIVRADASGNGLLPGYSRYDLKPGVYCGGLKIRSSSDVRLAPGIYVVKDGPLEVDLGARLVGENVGFYLTGDGATFSFGQESIINLTAPKDGLMAGLLFFEDRNAPAGRTHEIRSSNARTLLGTIYLPRGDLSVASLRPIADASAYTAIVAKKLSMSGSPTLVLNADYSATDVPVPAGVGPTGGGVFLRD